MDVRLPYSRTATLTRACEAVCSTQPWGYRAMASSPWSAGNTFGKLFTLTTFGESHGPAIGGVVDGCPPGLALSEEILQADVERRRSGKSRHTSQRREPDRVRILSGVFEGHTTGAPIGLVIDNED